MSSTSSSSEVEFIRHVKVDRTRTPREVLDATGRKQYIDNDVIETMPKGDGEEVDVHFFMVGHLISDEDLEKEFDSRGYKPDPYSLAAVNEADPDFADQYPNATHWKDADGNWCHIMFRQWCVPGVDVNRLKESWCEFWWFAGVSK